MEDEANGEDGATAEEDQRRLLCRTFADNCMREAEPACLSSRGYCRRGLDGGGTRQCQIARSAVHTRMQRVRERAKNQGRDRVSVEHNERGEEAWRCREGERRVSLDGIVQCWWWSSSQDAPFGPFPKRFTNARPGETRSLVGPGLRPRPLPLSSALILLSFSTTTAASASASASASPVHGAFLLRKARARPLDCLTAQSFPPVDTGRLATKSSSGAGGLTVYPLPVRSSTRSAARRARVVSAAIFMCLCTSRDSEMSPTSEWLHFQRTWARYHFRWPVAGRVCMCRFVGFAAYPALRPLVKHETCTAYFAVDSTIVLSSCFGEDQAQT
jgi:hypothetical protein